MNLHYTKPEMVKNCLTLIPFESGDSVLDAGSGTNKVWYSLCNQEEKYECELEDGNDFFKWDQRVDWVIGNPPFKIGYKFVTHASHIADKGIAFLFNINGFNSFTPKRFGVLAQNGFYVNCFSVMTDKRWFGRYYFIVFMKRENDFISWNTTSY